MELILEDLPFSQNHFLLITDSLTWAGKKEHKNIRLNMLNFKLTLKAFTGQGHKS